MGLDVIRLDGTPLFPITWKDFQNHLLPFVAGFPEAVHELVTLHRKGDLQKDVRRVKSRGRKIQDAAVGHPPIPLIPTEREIALAFEKRGDVSAIGSIEDVKHLFYDEINSYEELEQRIWSREISRQGGKVFRLAEEIGFRKHRIKTQIYGFVDLDYALMNDPLEEGTLAAAVRFVLQHLMQNLVKHSLHEPPYVVDKLGQRWPRERSKPDRPMKMMLLVSEVEIEEKKALQIILRDNGRGIENISWAFGSHFERVLEEIKKWKYFSRGGRGTLFVRGLLNENRIGDMSVASHGKRWVYFGDGLKSEEESSVKTGVEVRVHIFEPAQARDGGVEKISFGIRSMVEPIIRELKPPADSAVFYP